MIENFDGRNIGCDQMNPFSVDKFIGKLENFLKKQPSFESDIDTGSENALDDYIAYGYGSDVRSHLLGVEEGMINYVDEIFDYQLEMCKNNEEYTNDLKKFEKLKKDFLEYINYNSIGKNNSGIEEYKIEIPGPTLEDAIADNYEHLQDSLYFRDLEKADKVKV